MPFLMEIDDAVRLMVRGIERGDPETAFPWPLHAFVRATSTLPRGAYQGLMRLARRKAKG
jgi:hypothetical protein